MRKQIPAFAAGIFMFFLRWSSQRSMCRRMELFMCDSMAVTAAS